MTTTYSVFKQRFKTTIIDSIYQEVTSNAATYYHWFGKENTWTDFLSPFIPSSIGDYPGQPSDNFRYELHVRRDILTAKKINSSDVSYVIRRIDWTANTAYDMYDDAYDTSTNNGASTVGIYGATRLEDSNFYVLTTDYNVYKCIDNNGGVPSTVMPNSTSTSIFSTTDGYRWKFMYTIPVSLRNRFLSSTYMPVSNALKAAFYSSGEINQINIINGGLNYNPDHTTAVVTGDGNKLYNPVELSSLTKNISGDGYTSATISIAAPFANYVAWSSGASVAQGIYIAYTNPATTKTNFYYVVSGNTLGMSGPVHLMQTPYIPATENNGNCQLRYAGQLATGSATVSAGAIDTVSLDSQGYGYSTAPVVTVSDPIAVDAVWTANTGYALNKIVSHNGLYYKVTTSGVSGSVAPTHTSGTVANGTTQLQYMAKIANVTAVVIQTQAEISLQFGTSGEIVSYTILDPGTGYTNANIVVNDTTSSGSGAVLTADFTVGNIDTLQANVELLAVNGSIEAIKVVNGGSGYGAATVEILGDGTGATASVTCSGGRVVGITMTNVGSGYTWTDVRITGNVGSDGAATARAIMSPIGGHGSDAINELGANSLVFYTSISRDLNQGFEINNDYRKVGLVRNFKEHGTNRRFQGSIGSGCVLLTGSFNKELLDYDMLLLKDGYKKYRIVDFNDTQILVSVFNNFPVTVGDTLVTDPTDGGHILYPPQQPTNIFVTDVAERTINPFSGDFLFFEVTTPYTPTAEQIITVRTVVTI